MGRGRRRKGRRQQNFRKTPRTRVNHEIRIENIRLVGFKDIASEVMPTKRALGLAQDAGLDLVEIGPDQDPPICKIIDYGKYKFNQEKKAKDSKKNQHVIQVKEIKLRPKIDVHDYQIKLKKTIEFLQKGDKVKVSLRFRGREMAHPELGMDLVKKMRDDAEEYSKVDVPPKMEGRQIIMVLAPKAGMVRVAKGESTTPAREKRDPKEKTDAPAEESNAPAPEPEPADS